MIGATVDAIDPPETVDEQLAPILEVIELSSDQRRASASPSVREKWLGFMD